MKQSFFGIFAATALSIVTMSGDLWADSIEGLWKTFDDKSGEPKSIIEIYVEDGRLYGRIRSLFPKEGEDPDPICEKCPGDLKNQKIIGMFIVEGLEEKDGIWTGGKILDPENGKSYRCKLWLEDNTLRVRGSLLIFHRTQTWLRAESESRVDATGASRLEDLQEEVPDTVIDDSSAMRPE